MLISLVRRALAPHRRLLLGLAAAQLVSVAASLYLPNLNADIVDHGVVRADTGHIWRTGGWMLLVSLVQVMAAIVAAWFASRIAMNAGRDLRAQVFGAVQRFSAREVSRFGAPSLITRSTNDVQQVQTLVLMGANLMMMAPIMMVGGIIMALHQDVGLSWLMVVAVPVLGVAIGFLVSRMVPGFRLVQERLDGVNRILREHLSGMRVVRAFVREPYEEQRFGEANASLAGAQIRVGNLMAFMFPTVFLVMNLSTAAVWWFGGHRIADGDLQIGALSAYMSYLMQILMAVMMATFMLVMIPRAAVAAERIGEVLETRSSVVEPARPVTPEGGVRGVVELDHAQMRYPGAERAVVDDLTFTARPGQTVAFIGSTGSGKSTVLGLVARLFDVTDGAVRIDGVDVRELDPTQLWGNLGLVPQQAYLFSGTVATNLRYGKPDASDEELWDALEVAQARDFVERMGGLDSTIEQGGSNVSGGQRQRLCIARALVARPRIYLFDDSFSALDLATDRRLRAALAPRVHDATVLLVAQRVSTILDADLIVVLDDGRAVGMGRHDDLLVNCPEYREVVESQLGRQEDAA